jgi:sugar/nucleoside kinase (ribokinase family)
MHLLSLLFFMFLAPLCHIHAKPVMTISDAIVDFILFVDDPFLDQVPGKKGGCDLVDHQTILNILNRSQSEPHQVPGGSAVNMLKGLATLGHECTLIVTVGEDDAGDFFLEGLRKNGLNLLLDRAPTPTGKCISLVTPNGERTMRTYLGASTANAELNLSASQFNDLTLFHIEGYQLQHYALIKQAITLAREAGATISMDLASFETVRAHRDFIWDLLKDKQIDLLFANKDEARALTGMEPSQACSHLSSYCSTIAVTLGEKGSLVQQGEEQLWHPAFLVSAIDTTGAGDLFIGGFLNGYLRNYSPKTCAWIGSLLASHVVQVVGSEIPPERWEIIHQELLSNLKEGTIGDDDNLRIDFSAENFLDRLESSASCRITGSASALISNR